MRLFSLGFLLAGAAMIFPRAASAQTQLPTVNAWSKTVKEGNSGLKFTYVGVSLAAPVADTVRVAYWTKPINATQGSASLPYKSPVAGTDYRQSGGYLTFLPGERAASVRVAIYGDTANEGNETFEVRLRVVEGSAVAGKRATVTIRDDDAPTTPTGKIVFNYGGSSFSDRATENLALINPDGSNLTNLIADRDGQLVPQFLPDGSRVVFVNELFDYDISEDKIQSIGADGTSRREVTPANLVSLRFDLSGDGKRLVFAGYDTNTCVDGICQSGLYTAQSDGSNLQLLSNAPVLGSPTTCFFRILASLLE